MTLDLAEIKRTVAGGESETVEFKSSTAERDPAGRALCAMLNHRGGRVLFGVTPEGKVVGQEVSGRTIERLAQQFAKIDPPAFPSIDRIPVRDGLEIVVAKVSKGSTPPYSYNGQAWRRVGNTNRSLSRDEYNRLVLQFMHAKRRWENEPEPDWTLADLDADEIVRTVEEAIRIGRLDETDTGKPLALLRGLGLLTDGDGLLRAAVVLFGKKDRLRAQYPQCTIRAARFLGTDKSEFLDSRQFHGNAIELLASSQRFVREHLRIASRFEEDSFIRIDEPAYPPRAVREALANAICHRDYSSGGGAIHVAMYDDRLEIGSPGTLPSGLTPEALYLPHESDPWNPLIANVFFRRGIIEMWGKGTVKLVERATAAGLPRPEFEDRHGSVTVRFRPNGRIPHQVTVKLSKRHRAILALLTERGPLALREMIGEIPAGPRTSSLASWEKRRLQAELQELQTFGLIECWGTGPGARWERK